MSGRRLDIQPLLESSFIPTLAVSKTTTSSAQSIATHCHALNGTAPPAETGRWMHDDLVYAGDVELLKQVAQEMPEEDVGL